MSVADKILNCRTEDELGRCVLDERDKIATRKISGIDFMRAYTEIVDLALIRIFELSLAAISSKHGIKTEKISSNVSLIATGGYGRKEMSPLSDIDVTFISAVDDDPEVDLFIKSAYRFMMDSILNGAGLKAGYAYRYIGDSSELPLETQTALLDARYITGCASLYEQFNLLIINSIIPAAFVMGHISNRRKAYEKFRSTPYIVEPDVKEGMGGLRDLQAARWIAQITYRVSGNDVWNVLRSRGILSDKDVNRMDSALEYLVKIRNSLHFLGKRGSNKLTYDSQEKLVSIQKFSPDIIIMMKKYYIHAEMILHVFEKVSSACLEQSLDIESGIVLRGRKIRILDKGLLSRDHSSAVRIFQHMIDYGAMIDWDSIDMLSQFASMRTGKSKFNNLTTGSPVWNVMKTFARILSNRNACVAIKSMVDTGMLQWLIPEFTGIMHLIPSDAAHEYTVGAHSLEVMSQFSENRSNFDNEMKDLFLGISQPEILSLAALLHDIGKANADEPHSLIGAQMAFSIAQRLGFSSDDAEEVKFLVQNHLTMSETARLRDLNDARTVNDFISIVDTHERLDMLYLLTAADIYSVGQSNWSEVQMRFLRELYHRASVLLRSSGGVPYDIKRHRGRISRELSLANIPKDEIEEHCDSMPAGYLLNTSPDDLAAHIGYVRSARAGKPVVRMKDDMIGRFTNLVICTRDDNNPGLLSKIAGVVSALGADIHAAQVFTRESTDRIAIDQLYIDFDHRNLPELKQMQLRSEMETVLSNDIDVESVFKKYGKKLFNKVELRNLKIMSHLSEQHTVIEIETEDQIGLLHMLTRAIFLCGWDIHSARVSTWGSKAKDVFYVTMKDGSKLNSDAAAKLKKSIANL